MTIKMTILCLSLAIFIFSIIALKIQFRHMSQNISYKSKICKRLFEQVHPIVYFFTMSIGFYTSGVTLAALKWRK